MWYIWKARNYNIFQRKTLTDFQVQKAAAAHKQTFLSAWQEQCQPEPHHGFCLSNSAQPPTVHRYLVDLSFAFSGIRCHLDASILPDLPDNTSRPACLAFSY